MGKKIFIHSKDSTSEVSIIRSEFFSRQEKITQIYATTLEAIVERIFKTCLQSDWAARKQLKVWLVVESAQRYRVNFSSKQIGLK